MLGSGHKTGQQISLFEILTPIFAYQFIIWSAPGWPIELSHLYARVTVWNNISLKPYYVIVLSFMGANIVWLLSAFFKYLARYVFSLVFLCGGRQLSSCFAS